MPTRRSRVIPLALATLGSPVGCDVMRATDHGSPVAAPDTLALEARQVRLKATAPKTTVRGKADADRRTGWTQSTLHFRH